ncbi:MAG: hypothetical protein K1X36_06840 [Pyrinomonadaceae bacterium]|nr:hypothetical protein [Pyrinomonadaceae bacterium]
MKVMRFRRLDLLFLLAFGLFGAQLAAGQTVNKCKVTKSLGGKFKIVSQARPVGSTDELSLNVVIKPENFTDEFLRDFMRRVDETFCNEILVGVAIFDSEKDSAGWFYDYATSNGRIDRRRGVYILDRSCGKNSLGYSSTKGRSIDEFEIENSNIIGECRRH